MGDRPASYRITDLASTDRPRERLASLGAKALSNAELIAILLRSGIEGKNVLQMAQTLIMEFGGLAGIHRASYEEICACRGIGPAKASQLR